MPIAFKRLSYGGCEYLGDLQTGGLYLTDAELSVWGLMIVVRHMHQDGTPVSEPEVGPNRPMPPVAMLRLTAVGDGQELVEKLSGTMGSLGEAMSIHHFVVPDVDVASLSLDVAVEGSPAPSVHIELRPVGRVDTEREPSQSQ